MPEVVKHVIPMPIGSLKELPKSEDAEEEYGKMLKAFICVTEKYKSNKPAPAVDQEHQNEDDEHASGENQDKNMDDLAHVENQDEIMDDLVNEM